MPGEPPPSGVEDEDAEIARMAHQQRVARGLRLAARRALALARRYRHEEGARGEREVACVEQALAWRAAARRLRAEATPRPGLARATSRAPGARQQAG